MPTSSSAMLSKMRSCTIADSYDGLNEFESFTQFNPDDGFSIAWNVLTGRDDPGRDDHVLCCELLDKVGRSAGRERIERRLMEEWSQINEGIRRNFIEAFASSNAVSIDVVCSLFDLPETTVRERHRIVAILFAYRKAESLRAILELTGRIGHYCDPERESVLRSFVETVLRDNQVGGIQV